MDELRTVYVQETSSCQKADRLPKVRTLGIVVPPKNVLQSLRIREHENVLLPRQIIQKISSRNEDDG